MTNDAPINIVVETDPDDQMPSTGDRATRDFKPTLDQMMQSYHVENIKVQDQMVALPKSKSFKSFKKHNPKIILSNKKVGKWPQNGNTSAGAYHSVTTKNCFANY